LRTRTESALAVPITANSVVAAIANFFMKTAPCLTFEAPFHARR
jgi:hypothetical protein